MLGSSGAYASSPEKILKMWCSLVHFEVYFDQGCVLKNSLKINIFLYKTYFFYIKHNAQNTIYRYTLAMGYLATGEIFENMLQLKPFGL